MNSKTRKIIIEIFKWLLVIWCILPLFHPSGDPVQLYRIIPGIMLFVIFTGKVLYDIIMEQMVRRKQRTLKEDIVTFLGATFFILLLILGVIVMLAFFFRVWHRTATKKTASVIEQPQNASMYTDFRKNNFDNMV